MEALLDQRQIPYPRGSVFDGQRENLSVAVGHSFLDNRVHVTLYGVFRHIAGLSEDHRDYSSCALTAHTVGGIPTSILECGGAFLAYPGNFSDNLGNTYQVTPDRTFVPGVGRFNYAPFNFYQRPDKRYNAGGFASFDVSSAIQPYAEVMYMHDRSLAQTSPSGDASNTETINCDNPLLSDQQRSRICRPGNFVGEENGGSPTKFVDPVTGAMYNRGWLFIARRSVESGPAQDDLTHKSIRLLGGSTGDLGHGITYDASYLFGRVGLDWESRNNLSITRLSRALDVVSDPSTGEPVCRSALIARLGPAAAGMDADCVPWDVFAPGQVTPEAVAYLSLTAFMRGSFKEQIGNVNATVQLDRWGLGSPWSEEGSAINVGAEYRKDSVDFEPDEATQNGDIAGFAPQVVPIRGSIDTKEIFGEARIPLVTDRLVHRLAFEAGFRKSWYESPGSEFSTDAYKLAVDLTPVTGLRLRASQQRANRAPNVQELFTPVQADSFSRDPCAGSSPVASEIQCALTGVSPRQYGHILQFPAAPFRYNSIIGGNEDLQPETATTRSIGIVLEPRFPGGFNATIDWWDIKLKDAIAKIGAQTIIDTCIATADPAFCSRLHRDPNGSLWLGNGHVDDRQANIGGFRTSGLDFAANYLTGLGRIGSADFEFRGSYVLKWVVDNGGLSTPYDCAGLFGDPCDLHPRWKHTLRGTWNRSPAFSLSLQWRHIGGVKLAALDPKFGLTDMVSPANTGLPSQDYFDVATMFRIGKRLEFRVGANNILDRQPPLVVRNTAAGAIGLVNGNSYPELYDALGRYVFASVTVNLVP